MRTRTPNDQPLHDCDNVDEIASVVVIPCDLEAKRINLCDPCGRPSCGCNPCKNHDGPMCQRTSACRSYDVSNDEEFVLVLCRAACTAPDLDAEFLVKQKKCGEVSKVKGVIAGDCVSVRMAAGSLSPGWYDVQVRLTKCNGQRWTSDIKSFRIAESLSNPDEELIEC